MASRELQHFRCPKADRKWDNWVSGFTMYLALVMQAQLCRAPALGKYFDMVHCVYTVIPLLDTCGCVMMRYLA